MTKTSIPIEDSRLVTTAVLKATLDTALKEEQAITNEKFSSLEEKMDKFQRSLEMFAKAILGEITAMREENKEFRQQREQLYRTDTIHERKIDDLDNRVLKLETARQA